MAVCTAEVIFGWIEERICAIRASWEAAELLLVDDKPLVEEEVAGTELTSSTPAKGPVQAPGMFLI